MVGLTSSGRHRGRLPVLSFSLLEVQCLSAVRMWIRRLTETSRKGLWLSFFPELCRSQALEALRQ